MSDSSRVGSRQVTTLRTCHPTDRHWWGVMELEPAGEADVHVRVSGATPDGALTGASLPFVKLDELQEMIDLARERCATMGFVS